MDPPPQDLESTKIDVVEIDGLVILKIIKHCKENSHDCVTGQLLGLDLGNTLEVTNCFPLPKRSEEEEEEEFAGDSSAEYQTSMMRHLRTVNVDCYDVGWYISANLGSFFNTSTIEEQYTHQVIINNSVLVVYDPLRTKQGTLAIKAYRLTQKFMSLYKTANFSQESIIKQKISFNDIFEEVPIRIHNSGMINAFLYELEDSQRIALDYERLDLSTNPFLERNLELLLEYLDEISSDQHRFFAYLRNLRWQQGQQAILLEKKKAENAARRSAGEEVEEEDLSQNPAFKQITSPSRIDYLLMSKQVNNFCEQMNGFVGQSFTKLFLLNGFSGSKIEK